MQFIHLRTSIYKTLYILLFTRQFPFLDDNLYNSLAFRESLVVGTLGLDARKPIPCGVLCLDIQQITGEKPLKRITPDIYKDNVYKKLLNQMHMNFDQGKKPKFFWLKIIHLFVFRNSDVFRFKALLVRSIR